MPTLRSKKQDDARKRNWHIYKLRGLYQFQWLITNDKDRELFAELVDRELARNGAETQQARLEKFRQEMLASDLAERLRNEIL